VQQSKCGTLLAVCKSWVELLKRVVSQIRGRHLSTAQGWPIVQRNSYSATTMQLQTGRAEYRCST
jgi:hypothetical protein